MPLRWRKRIWSYAHRRRRRRFLAAVLDEATGQLLNVFEGRDAGQLRARMAGPAPS